jgi:acylphosphatase
MKKAILHISGDVQQSGFRAKIVDIAKALDIKGYVANLPDKRVKIIAEGDETDLERFIKAVNIKNTLINVTDLEKEYFTPTEEYERFYKLVDDGETDERLDTAADLLKELIHVSKNGFYDLGSKIDGLGVDLGSKIDQNRIEITSGIRYSRDDFKSHFDERIIVIEHDIAQIKAKIML